MLRNLILSGGVAHEYGTTSALLVDLLQEVGIASEIHERFDVVEDGTIQDFDMLTLNCVRWTCAQTPDWRDEWAFELSEAARAQFLAFLEKGKGLLALHAATICFDDWPEFRTILGAWWEWDHSGHAPLQYQPMHIRSVTPPITAGLGNFVIYDELYTDPRIADRVDPLVDATWEGKAHPMLWAREYGRARVCYNALGHGPEAFQHPSNQLLLQRGALWTMNKLGGSQ